MKVREHFESAAQRSNAPYITIFIDVPGEVLPGSMYATLTIKAGPRYLNSSLYFPILEDKGLIDLNLFILNSL